MRLIDAQDPQHELVEAAVGILGNRREVLLIGTQNIAELWNVATRPIASNGLGLPPTLVLELFDETIEPICGVACEPVSLPGEFKRLLTQYGVVGKQVHDARLAALMLCWEIDSILTLNERNFRRYEPEGIHVVTPESLVSKH